MAWRKPNQISVFERDKRPLSGRSSTTALRKPRRSSPRARATNTWARELEALLKVRETVAFLIDSEGVIRDIQVPEPRQARSITGLLTGRSISEVFDSQIYDFIAAACRTATLLKRTAELGCSFRLAGQDHWFSILVNRSNETHPASALFYILLHDPASRGRMRIHVRQNGAGLDQSAVLAQLGAWEADLSTGNFVCSERVFDILGAPKDAPSVSYFFWKLVRGCYEKFAIASSSVKPATFGQDLELSCSSDSPRTVYAHTICIPEKAGLPLRFAGFIEEVTDKRKVEMRLQTQTTLLSAAEKLASFGTWDLNLQTGKTLWSGALFQLLGLTLAGDSNEPAYASNLHPDDRDRIRGVLADAIRNSSECEYISRYRTPKGDWRVHQTRVSPIRSELGGLTHMVGVVRDISDQTQAEEDLHRLSQRVMRARDEERRAMARELHESAGQSLASLKMNLSDLRESLAKTNTHARSLLESCYQLTEATVREVRTVSYLMHPPMLDEAGLACAVRWYARGFSDRSKIQVAVDIPEDFGRLAQEVELAIFRLIQEALTNVHRYSGSRTATIHLARGAAHVRVEVVDKGCGLARPIRPNSGDSVGVGIAGMRERVHELHGVFEIETAPGRGTAVRAVFPDSCPSGQPRVSVA